MNPQLPLPSHAELSHFLNKIQPTLQPAEMHGLLCGYLCITSNPEKFDSKFEHLLVLDKKNKEARQILKQLYQTSYPSLSQFSFEFSLILPEEDTDINIRTEALGLWCQGFLTGLAQSPTSLQNYPEQDIREALGDLTEIAQIDFGHIPANEEDEKAYFELVEYVRLTVLMFFNTLQINHTSQETPNPVLLH
ncbi:MAG: hypothetical protein K0S27_392 [Gammaproteobacteria bacterium]|jgi:uncharacterized protein YgfB (UPF0149 family)|nr:hypothetical protein [Gammaproteobacteria bacterium]